MCPCCFKPISFSSFMLYSFRCSQQILLAAPFTSFEGRNKTLKCMLSTWFSKARNSVKSQPKLRHFIVMAISMPNFSTQASATHAADLFKRRQQKLFMEGKNSFPLSSCSHMDEMFSLKLSKKFTFEQNPRASFEQF